jgi:hypothetical protein
MGVSLGDGIAGTWNEVRNKVGKLEFRADGTFGWSMGGGIYGVTDRYVSMIYRRQEDDEWGLGQDCNLTIYDASISSDGKTLILRGDLDYWFKKE